MAAAYDRNDRIYLPLGLELRAAEMPGLMYTREGCDAREFATENLRLTFGV